MTLTFKKKKEEHVFFLVTLELSLIYLKVNTSREFVKLSGRNEKLS